MIACSVVRAPVAALVLVLGAAMAAPVPASSAPVPPALEQAFRAGIQAYDGQEWDRAIEAWEGLARFRVEHPAVEYNLGNAYLKKNDYGRAVLHWERALRLDPRDGEARENLKLVRGLLVDDVGTEPAGLARFLDDARRWAPLEETALAALIAWQLLGAALFAATLWPGPLRRAAAGVAALALLFLLVAAPLLVLQVRAAEERSRMVVLAPAVEARSGPGEQYTTTFTVHEGLVVRSRESASGWEHVELPNGLHGWVPADAAERI